MNKTIEFLLRISVFGTFIGHGLFALLSGSIFPEKLQWINYLTSIGLDSEISVTILPIIGFVDILVALIILFKPHKYIALWAFIWGLSTALARPISGENILDFVERFGNFIPALILFLILKNNSKKDVKSLL